MEAMIIVGLCLGSFVKGPDHELSLKTFIKHVTAVTPIITEKRNSMRADTQFFLRGQRVTLFELWNIEMKSWNGRRTEDGKFLPQNMVPEPNGPPLKKPRTKFDFSMLREEDAEV